MKYIKEYSSYLINEAAGLAEPTLIYSDYLLEEATEYFDAFLDSKLRKQEVKVSYNFSDTEVFNNKLWPLYPVSKMQVVYTFNKVNDEKYRKSYPELSKKKLYVATGACSNFSSKRSKEMSYILPPVDDRTDHAIYLRLDIGVLVTDLFLYEENFEVLRDQLLLEVESTIIHELNHAYEGYQRLISGRGQISVDVTIASDYNRGKVKKEVFKDWVNKFGYYLYTSEKHEVNAMVQEAWPYVKKYKPEELSKFCHPYIQSQEMKKFSCEEFKNHMISKINEFYPGINPEIIMNRIKNSLANYLEVQRKESWIEFEDSPSLTADKIRKMTLDKFLTFAQARINSSGDKIQKKILKLYSLKNKQ